MTTAAVMPEAKLTDEMVEAMQARAGTELRIDHSVFNEEATRIAVIKFTGGIGDINPLWTDPEHAGASSWAAPVAPPSFVMGCFSGIQFGWPGLGAFHSASRLRFHHPVYWHDTITSSCRYEGFSGPSPSRFAGRMVTDHFANRYVNQRGETVAEIDWDVVNFERATARSKGDRETQAVAGFEIPHPWTEDELDKLRAQVLSEMPRGADPRWFEDVAVGDELDTLTKGPIGLTDEVAFVSGGGAPIPRLSAHAVALHAYEKHPAWCFRDPETGALEPIYSVHYNRHAANAMGVTYQYDVGFQRQCWQIQHLTHWCSDRGWVKTAEAQYRKFVYLSDVVMLSGTVTEKFVDDDGEHCVRVETMALNQRDENVMPGSAVIALPSRDSDACPASRPAAAMGEAVPSLEEFLVEAEAFLASRWPKKQEPAGPAPFVWGTGSDDMRVFQEPEPAEEAEQMAAVRGWRQALFDAGLAWLSGPTEYGGRALPSSYERAFESLSRRYAVPGDAMLTVSLGMIAPTIHRYGTPEQSARWLPALRSGKLIACQLFSEPNAGSDLASIATRAIPDPDGGGWRLTGQKVWTSGAHLADIGEIICRTSDGPRHHNLTAFVVDMHAPGVEVRPLRQMTGGAAFNEVFLTDVFVPDGDRLGDLGEGWKIALTTLAHERSAMGHSAFGGVGLLRTDRLVAMLEHTGRADDPVARQDLADVVIHLRAARYLQQRTGAVAKATGSVGSELSMNKLALSDNFRRLSDFAVKVLGSTVTADTGEWGTWAWTSVLLGAPGYRLGGGTDQILKTVLAERVLGLPR